MFTRTALIGLLTAVVLAILPAVAGASIAPVASLVQSAGTTAGSSPPTGLNINFRPLFGDSAKDLSIAFPPGFLLNLQTDGGICLASGTPNPSCVIGSGTINGPAGTPVTLYLVAPPTLNDIAGVAVVGQGGATKVGELSLETTPLFGLTLLFRDMTPGINELALTFNSPRLPTTCNTEQSVAIEAASWQGSSATTTAPLTVSGCATLPYAPTVAATVYKHHESEVSVVVMFTLGTAESATNMIKFGLPGGLKLNRVLVPCFEGTNCSIGNITAQSPLLPPFALANGPMLLSGSLGGAALGSAPSGVKLTTAFPAPYSFSFTAPVNLTERTITYSNLYDLPLSSLAFVFIGTPQGAAFTTTCEPGAIEATMTPEDGNAPHSIVGAVTSFGCPDPKPRNASASGSLSGLMSGHPQLKLHARRASSAGISALSLTLPAGLSFDHGAITARRGLALSSSVKTAAVRGGVLRVTLAHPASAVSLSLGGPLLVESASLQRRVREHRAGRLLAHLRIVGADGHASTVGVS
jgi:hypothetical protein